MRATPVPDGGKRVNIDNIISIMVPYPCSYYEPDDENSLRIIEPEDSYYRDKTVPYHLPDDLETCKSISFTKYDRIKGVKFNERGVFDKALKALADEDMHISLGISYGDYYFRIDGDHEQRYILCHDTNEVKSGFLTFYVVNVLFYIVIILTEYATYIGVASVDGYSDAAKERWLSNLLKTVQLCGTVPKTKTVLKIPKQKNGELQFSEAKKKYNEKRWAYNAWVSACESLESNREKYAREILDAEIKKYRAAAEAEKRPAVAAIEKELKRKQNELKEAEQTLSSLGFFAFSKKKAAQAQIESLKLELKEIEARHDDAERVLREAVRKSEEKAGKLSDYAEKAAQKYPTPEAVEKPKAPKIPAGMRILDGAGPISTTRYGRENDEIKYEILRYLKSNYVMATPQDLQQELQEEFPELSVARINCMLLPLVEACELEVTYQNGSTYYSYNYD